MKVKIDTPEIVQTRERMTAMIHLTVPRSEIQKVMGPGIGEVMATIAAQGIEPDGPWLTHHLKMDPAIFDFEICVPVKQSVKPAGRVVAGILPAARVVQTVYHGPYEGLGDAWGELLKWIKDEGLSPAQDLWEVYTVGPESGPDPAAWRTELNKPLAK
jgi:effector-binding domain-containing protein